MSLNFCWKAISSSPACLNAKTCKACSNRPYEDQTTSTPLSSLAVFRECSLAQWNLANTLTEICCSADVETLIPYEYASCAYTYTHRALCALSTIGDGKTQSLCARLSLCTHPYWWHSAQAFSMNKRAVYMAARFAPSSALLALQNIGKHHAASPKAALIIYYCSPFFIIFRNGHRASKSTNDCFHAVWSSGRQLYSYWPID